MRGWLAAVERKNIGRRDGGEEFLAWLAKRTAHGEGGRKRSAHAMQIVKAYRRGVAPVTRMWLTETKCGPKRCREMEKKVREETDW